MGKATEKGIRMKTMKTFWLSISLAYWALLPQFYLVYDQGNRYSLTWTHGMYVAILAAILSMGCVYFLIAAVMQWMTRRHATWEKAAQIVMGGVVGVIFLRTIFSLLDKGGVLPPGGQRFLDIRLVKVGVYLLPVIGMAWGLRLFQVLGRLLFFALSMLLLLFLAIPWFWPTYGWDDAAMSHPGKDYFATTNSIYIFIFDAWSVQRTFTDGQMAKMPNLSELLTHADLYTNAQSCGAFTHVSIPRFLYQPDSDMAKLSYDEVRKSVQHNWFPRLGYTSIFDLSDNHWKTALGYYLYYPSLIGDRVDYCSRYSASGSHSRDIYYYRQILSSQTEFLRHLGLNLQSKYPEWTLETDTVATQQKSRAKLKKVLDALPSMNIAFLHIPVPHDPYQYLPDGTLRETRLPSTLGDSTNVVGYLDNLGYMDVHIHDIVDTLKRRGDYESSLIIMTSDHTWESGEERPYPVNNEDDLYKVDDTALFSYNRHVPLVIKHPGQTVSRTFDQVVSCWDLHHLFSQYLEHPSKTLDFKWWTDEKLPSGQRTLPDSAEGME